MKLNHVSHAAIVAAALTALCAGLSAGPALAQSVVAPVTVDPAISRLQDRVDDLERQLRQATGENERLQRERDLARADAMRLEKVVDDLMAQQAAAAAAPPPVAPEPPTRAAPKSPPPPTATASPPNAASAAVQSPGQNAGPASGPASPSPAQGAAQGDAAAAYKAIRTQLMRGDAAGAETALRQWISQYPNDPQAADAKYWLGQTLLSRSANDEAAKVFVDLLRAHPNATVAPDAMGRLGVALTRMGQKAKGCAAFADVVRRFPNASAAKARASEEAQKASCPAG